MPYALRPECLEPNCFRRDIARKGRCALHAPAEERRRLPAAARGYDSKWDQARRHYLAHHPLCRICEQHGRVTQATVVDHIQPHRGNMLLFWARANWQSLCAACHNRKTGRGR